MRGIHIGSKIYWNVGTEATPEVRNGTVTRISGKSGDVYGRTLFVDNAHKPEDCIYEVWCYPEAYAAEYVNILNHRAKLKKDLDDSMKLIYELCNKMTRENPET